MNYLIEIIKTKLLYHYIIFFSISIISSQEYISADPYYLLKLEKKMLESNKQITPTFFRPYIKSRNNKFIFSLKNEFYFNDNAPNQENMDVRYLGKGFGTFNAFHFAWKGQYLSFSAEPYLINNQNKSSKFYSRPNPYKYLNDYSKSNGKEYVSQGVRNAHLYLHYKGFGIGYSNESMWWGPGLHNSLTMTNNTIGFPHYTIGTIEEIRWKKIGFFTKYTLATIKHNIKKDNIYYTSIGGFISYYSNPIITFGITRNYLTGGYNSSTEWTIEDASKIIFEGVFLENLKSKSYTTDRGGDGFDQTLISFLSLLYPKSKLKLYIEIGFNDNRENYWDFVIHPDHSLASIVGLQNYGIFNNDNLVFGFEYSNLINSRMQVFRGFPPWYSRDHYDDWSYEGRRWGAHSGSDSDDFLIYFGWISEKWSFVPGFNYERHGVTTYRPPELKFEYRLNIDYKLKNNLVMGVYLEQQSEYHLGFPKDHYWLEVTGKRKTNTIIIRFEKEFKL
jgi:hypothetical protein